MRGRVVLCSIAILSLFLSSYTNILSYHANADATENYPLSAVITNPYTLQGSSSITYSNDGSLVAVAYYQSVAIMETTHRTFIKEINIGNTVLKVTFSDDDSILFVGLESPYMSTLAMSLYDTNSWERIGVNEDGKEVTDISTLDNSDIFASSNEGFGVNEYYFSDSSNEIFSYNGEHSDAVTCLDHTQDGKFLITGGIDGNIFIWNRTNQNVAEFQGERLHWPTEFEINDCSVSPDGTKFAWTANSLLQVRSIPEGNYITSLVLEGFAEQLEWSKSANELWIRTQTSSPNMLVLNSTTFDVINNFDLGHRVEKFAISPQNDEFIVTSASSHISIFSLNRWAPYNGMIGLDTDQDGIPDTYDSDDDGDGIGDDFEFVCDEGSECSIHPDSEMVRHISISINDNKLVIIDKFQLNASQSAPIRQLAAGTVNTDGLVDEGEALKIQRMLCSGTDESELKSDWANAANVNNSVIISSSVRCDTKLGLSGTEKFDSQTRIQLRWFIEMTLSNDVPRPFSITFDPKVSAPKHTIAQVTPNSPYLLTISHQNSIVHNQFPIYPSSDTFVINIQALPEPEPTSLDLAIIWLSVNWWIIALIVLVFLLITITVVRRSNAISFDYEDEDLVTSRKATTTRRRQPMSPPKQRKVEVDRIQPERRPKPRTKPKTGRPSSIRGKDISKIRSSDENNSPPIRAVKKVKREPGTVTQTGDAPDGEEWNYAQHGAYWDTDDPDAIDPYGEAQQYHDEENAIKEIANQFADEMADDSQTSIDDVEEPPIDDVDDEINAALSKLTGKNVITDDEQKSTKKKNRRKVKRRKK